MLFDGYWLTAALVASWLIRLVMFPVVVSRNDQPATCLSWLMVIFFTPWVGLAAYLLIGENRLGRKRLRERAEAFTRFEKVSERDVDTADRVDVEQYEEHSILVSLAERVGGLPVVGGNSLDLLSETGQVIERLEADIDRAERHVHLLFYIFADDEVGRRIGAALERAVGRGVECRVLADAVGSRRFFRKLAPKLRAAGVAVHSMLPANFLRRRMARLDLRNHRKLAIIDASTAWTGSQNIVEATYGHRKAGEWRDVMARITGPVVRQAQLIFLEDWYYETGELLNEDRFFPELPPTGDLRMQVIPTGPDQPTEAFQQLVVEAIHTARQRIMITSPYFIPDETLHFALRLAAARGVEIDIIVPNRSDHRLVDAAGEWHCGQLMGEGIRVHRFQEGLLHSKLLTIDDSFGMFGSANYDIRSFHLNFEMNISVYDTQVIQRIRELQESYRAASRPFGTAEWERRSRGRRMACNIAKIFSPLL